MCCVPRLIDTEYGVYGQRKLRRLYEKKGQSVTYRYQIVYNVHERIHGALVCNLYCSLYICCLIFT